ncbi:hypothetical protein SAMN05216428_11293 [Nitrosospira sp. Nsp11]|nr:hypothetical protein SAMN05216428_11293 [Nitrosospira sp. Nsp11]
MIEALVVNRLIKWARWKLDTGVALGYPSQSSFTRLVPPPPYFHDPRIDADCLLTDRAVNLLPEVYKLVIRLEYIDAIPSEMQRAHCYGKSRRTYRDDRTTAYTMLGHLIDTLMSSRQEAGHEYL